MATQQEDGKAWNSTQVSLICNAPTLDNDITLHPS